MRSPLWALLAGALALLVVSSYLSHFLFVPGTYRQMPWLHLSALPVLVAFAAFVLRRLRHERWLRRVAAGTGVAACVVATGVQFGLVLVGARIPPQPEPSWQVAPEFALPDPAGDIVRLSKLRARGPVVVAFFRGAFDRFAHAQLVDLESRRSVLLAAGASLVAISGDAPDELATLSQRLGLGYPLLSDADLATTRSYGVEQTGAGLPRPVVLVVARDGSVPWSHASSSGLDLPSPDAVVSAVLRAR
jgi:peroxiredoxin